jgi:hypothetical protein
LPAKSSGKARDPIDWLRRVRVCDTKIGISIAIKVAILVKVGRKVGGLGALMVAFVFVFEIGVLVGIVPVARVELDNNERKV